MLAISPVTWKGASLWSPNKSRGNIQAIHNQPLYTLYANNTAKKEGGEGDVSVRDMTKTLKRGQGNQLAQAGEISRQSTTNCYIHNMRAIHYTSKKGGGGEGAVSVRDMTKTLGEGVQREPVWVAGANLVM